MTLAQPGRRRIRLPRPRTIIQATLLTVILAYAAFLRLDSLVGKYGPFTHPRWLVSLASGIEATRSTLVPGNWEWVKVARPYAGGDPINYLRFGREMRHFYQAHVREPVHVAAIRAFLAITDDQDIAISFASATMSVLAVFATFLLGSVVGSRWVGLAAAAAMAIEREVVEWAADGWRDDAFTAMVALSAWAILRFWKRPTWGAAVLAGGVAGVACLTRITAVSFLLPALASVAVFQGRAVLWRSLGQTALALVVMGAVVGPYLVNCYIEFGDPFYAVNFHTGGYRQWYGEPAKMEGALTLVVDRFRNRPVTATDTALRGLIVYPFEIKWRGFDRWDPRLSRALFWLSACGLLAWLWQPTGRQALLILVMSLVPYMLTWALPGGGEWRFTMPAYPFYLVSAFGFVALVCDGLNKAWAARGRMLARWRFWTRAAGHGLIAAGLVSTGWLGHIWSPVLVAQEALRAGEDTNIAPGPNDSRFFRDGWSDLVATGAVVARFAVTSQATMYVPLPEARPYRLAIRMDPVPNNPDQRVHVFLDQSLVATIALVWNPDRVGSYSIDVPASLANRSLAKLSFVADSIQPVGEAASLYPGLTESQPAAFRLWYVRVMPF